MKRVTVEFSIQGSVVSEKETEAAAVAELLDVLKNAGLDTSEVAIRTKVEEIVVNPEPPPREVYLGTTTTRYGDPVHIFASRRQYAEVVVYSSDNEITYWKLEELRTEDSGWHSVAASMLDNFLKRKA